MKWTFEQKLAWAKSYMAGEFVPVPRGFSGSMTRWHDRVRMWACVLSKYGEEGELPGQLHQGVVLRDDEERDALRTRIGIRGLQSVREGGRRVHRLVQRDEDQIPEGDEKMDAPFGLLRGKLRWTPLSASL